MQRRQKVSETINRGITAAAMTVAIATIYSAMAIDGGVSHETILGERIQTVFKLQTPDIKATQDGQDSRESLTTILLSSQGSTYDHR
ncbi:MAG: hypothetical protein AAF808_00205 [Cyanobacteria bacterium P01_D01_bin.2]